MGVPIQVITTITVATTAGGTAFSASSILAGSVYVEADEGNTGKIYIGDSAVSATNYMTVLSITASATAGGTAQRGAWINAPYPERPDASQLQLKSFYAIGSAASQKLHVTYFERIGNK